MSDDEQKDKPAKPDKPAWEDSHTAASLPSWWQPDAGETKPAAAQPPAAQPETPPLEAPMPHSSVPTQPPSPVDWPVSTTAKELPTWWRPEQPPSTPASHAAATVPPTPHAEPAMPPAPMQSAPPPAMQAPPMPQPAPPSAPMQSTPPPAMQPPANRNEKTRVLGVIPAAAPPMAILVVRSGPDMGFKFRIKPAGVASLGRDLENEVVLDDPAASRRHAEIEFKEGAYVLTDLGSINGTLVNDHRVTTKQRLAHGDRIVVGQDEIVISIM